MSDPTMRRRGYVSVPNRNLRAQLELLALVLEGMAKHKADPDYPAGLDTLGVEAAHDQAAAKLLKVKAMQLEARNASSAARGELALLVPFLEKIQSTLELAYGKRDPRLYDYGFRPPEKRGRRSKAATAKASHAKTSHAKASHATTGAGAGSSGTAETTGSPGSTTAPSTPPPSTRP